MYVQHKSASKNQKTQKPYGNAARTTFSIIYTPVMRMFVVSIT